MAKHRSNPGSKKMGPNKQTGPKKLGRLARLFQGSTASHGQLNPGHLNQSPLNQVLKNPLQASPVSQSGSGDVTNAAVAPGGGSNALATSSALAIRQKLFGSRLLFDLVLVRPWLLVCVFWVSSMVSIAIAINDLASPGQDIAKTVIKATPVEQTNPIDTTTGRKGVRITPLPTAEAESVNGASQPPDTTTLSSQTNAASRAGNDALPLPIWSVWAMVAACAGGCYMMSRQHTAALPPRRLTGRHRPSGGGKIVPIGKNSDRLVATANSGAQPQSKTVKRRKQKRRAKLGSKPQLNPQYAASQVMSIQPGGQIQQVNPTKAVKVAPPPKNVSFKVPPAQSANASVITVMPAEESHPLDWQGNSLAHKLDVRQNKSINSFL
jgi:hypothetical protein